jgi:hypothetical protein
MLKYFLKDKNHGREIMESKIEVLSTVKIQHSPDLYKIVDALNRTLKERDLMFGLALDQEDQNKAIFTIYRT